MDLEQIYYVAVVRSVLEDLITMKHQNGLVNIISCFVLLCGLQQCEPFATLPPTTGNPRSTSAAQSRMSEVDSMVPIKLLLSAALVCLNPWPASASEVTGNPPLISPCPIKESGVSCISTASVRQLDLYMPPWTFSNDVTTDEALARLKAAIQSDSRLSLIEQGDLYLRVRASRTFATDELTFRFNPQDRVVMFSSLQVDGPGVAGSFGNQRNQLEELKRRAKVFQSMGEDLGMATADTAPREGALGQLNSFLGIRFGTGFEDVLLDKADEDSF